MRSARAHLRERAGVKFVFAGNLQPHVVAGFRVPGRLGASFDFPVDHVIVARGEDAEVVGGLDRGRVLGQTVSDRGRVLGHCRFLNIIACLGADEEPFMSQHGVNVGGRSFEEVEEGTEVEVGLLVVEVDFSSVRLFGRQVVGQNFGFQPFGELIFEFYLGVERIACCPYLCEGEA